jgi:hypothetical protein
MFCAVSGAWTDGVGLLLYRTRGACFAIPGGGLNRRPGIIFPAVGFCLLEPLNWLLLRIFYLLFHPPPGAVYSLARPSGGFAV